MDALHDELTKKFYRIGDVSQILNLPQSTIRFWEKEFSELRGGCMQGMEEASAARGEGLEEEMKTTKGKRK